MQQGAEPARRATANIHPVRTGGVARWFTCVARCATVRHVIQSFRHKGLRDLFQTGATTGVRPDHQKRVLRILHALHQAHRLQDLSIPGFGLHPLHGKPKRYAVSVNGPWRITFEWIDGDAWRVGLEQYH